MPLMRGCPRRCRQCRTNTEAWTYSRSPRHGPTAPHPRYRRRHQARFPAGGARHANLGSAGCLPTGRSDYHARGAEDDRYRQRHRTSIERGARSVRRCRRRNGLSSHETSRRGTTSSRASAATDGVTPARCFNRTYTRQHGWVFGRPLMRGTRSRYPPPEPR